jgi:AraC family transcriptional regulator
MIRDLRTGETRPAVREDPILSSAPRAWKGFLLEKHRIGFFEATNICCLNHVVVLHGSPVTLEWNDENSSQTIQINAGQISLHPANVPYSVRTQNGGEFISVSLDPQFLACAAAEFGALQHIELTPRQGHDDPLIRELLISLKTEAAKAGDANSQFAESLATMLAVRLVRDYSAASAPVGSPGNGLSKAQLHRVLEFVQEHLAVNISLRQLAGVADLSPFHFARQFKRSTGVAPHEYVTRCRVERARSLLLQPFASLRDIASQVGFCDQSHLARHFKRLYGITPMTFVRRANHRKLEP